MLSASLKPLTTRALEAHPSVTPQEKILASQSVQPLSGGLSRTSKKG